MDRPSEKRVSGGLATRRKAFSVTVAKGVAAEADQNTQFCSRIGCSGRIKCSQNAGIRNLDKNKCSKSSFCSLNANELMKKPSRSSSVMTSTKRTCLDSKMKASSHVNSNPLEGSLSTELLSSNLSGYQSETMSKSKENRMATAGSNIAPSNVGPRKIFHHKSVTTPRASPVPSASRSSALGPYSRSTGRRSGLRNLKCNSVSDAVPPSCLPLELESIGNNTAKMRNSEGESSSSRRQRKTSPPSPIDRHNSPTTSGISISDSSRKSMYLNTKMRFSGLQNGSNNSSDVDINSFSPIHDSARPYRGPTSYRRLSSNDDNPCSSMPFTSSEPALTQLVNHDALHQLNIDGIAEVFALTLVRIREDGELTNEQILELETSLFLSGLNLFDQHRDMRLDIDNMSYEELLALEERMGTVSTALSEEALSKSLKTSIYQGTPSNLQVIGSLSEDGDDIKCSICQEEYVNGDEIGKLVECQHGYHGTCINQWLQLKNWCPICKASAAP